MVRGFYSVEAGLFRLYFQWSYAINKSNERRIFVLGVRGFPDVQGGIESHCEHLYPYIAEAGYDVTVLARSPYVAADTTVGRIKMKRLWSPSMTGVEAFIHTFIGVLYSILKRPDLLHIHAIGPSIFAPLARLFGLNVVCTHHGFDYEREKWGFLSSRLLKLGEFMAAKFSNESIAVSRIGADRLEVLYGRPVHTINNGTVISVKKEDSQILEQLGLVGQPYFLSVSRIVEEKRQLDLISAYLKLDKPPYKLVIVGGNGGDGLYFEKVQSLADSHPEVVMAGVQMGEDLVTLFRHASVFLHGSSLEGNPIVMLEAMSYGLPILASDIPPNLELKLDVDEYFPMGDISKLMDKMQKCIMYPKGKDVTKIARIRSEFSWASKAEETVKVYECVLATPGQSLQRQS